MLLNPTCTLAADDAFVDRVITVAINVNNLAILQMHLNATAASAHVTSCGFHLVPGFGGEVEVGFSGHGDVILGLRNSWSHHLLKTYRPSMLVGASMASNIFAHQNVWW